MNVENNSNISNSNFLRKIELPKEEKTESSSSIFDKNLVSNSKLKTKKLIKEDDTKILEEYNQNADDKDEILSKIQDFIKNNGGGAIDDGELPTIGPDIGVLPGFRPLPKKSGVIQTMPYIIDSSKPTQPGYIEYAYDLSQTFDINKEEN